MKNNRKDDMYKLLNEFRRILLINRSEVHDFSLNNE